MKRAGFSVAVLVVSLLFALCLVMPSIRVCAEPIPPSGGFGPPQDSGPIRLWRDEAGDLWIETPSLAWNITGGTSLMLRSSGTEQEWRPASQSPGARVIEALFLFPGTGMPSTARIFYALPDEAVVYVEHPVRGGEEGLEMSFRASDGLVRLTNRWSGGNESTPPRIAATLPQFVLVPEEALLHDSGYFEANPTALAPEAFEYKALWEVGGGQGVAWLRPEGRANTVVQSKTDHALSAPELGDAYDPKKFPDFFLPGQVIGHTYLFFYRADPGAPLQSLQELVARLQLELPDLNVANIMRTPRYDYGAPKEQPAAGDKVTFVARVANRGGAPTGMFSYAWYMDGAEVESGTHAGLSSGQMITMTRQWAWQDGNHTVRLTLDPSNAIPEVSEDNNEVEDRTNGLAAGFWVEQSVYDYFNVHQVDLGLGSVSWDDYAQRQIRIWNQMFAEATSPLTPQGIIDRVRLDKVTVVADGMLPSCATNFPDTNDKTIDLQWGWPSEGVGVPSGHNPACYGELNGYINHPEAQIVQYSLMHELSHARYLIDLYGFNVYVAAVHLSTDVDSTSPTLMLERDIENGGNFAVPAYLAIGGELIVCQHKSGNAFSDCSRGAEGTTPRPHSSGTLVNLALVRLQDGAGNLIEGSPAMPLIGWEDHLYYSRYPDDLMNGGLVYRQYSAYAWNRIAGRRPVCGNYNPPCNIGEYLRDLPHGNILEIHREDGQPLYGAKVELHRPRSYPSVYGKLFLKDPDAVYITDALGHVSLGASPFGDLTAEVGPERGLILLRITSAGESNYRFFEITWANEAYWAGQQDTAVYMLDTDLVQGTPYPTLTPTATPTATGTPRPTCTPTSKPDCLGCAIGTWHETAGLPRSMGAPGLGAGQQLIATNGRVYVFGGRDSGDARLVNVYSSAIRSDGTLSKWDETTPLPGRYYYHSEIQVQDRVYMITGGAGSTDVYYALLGPDGSVGSWTKTAELSPSRQDFAVAACGSYVYASGGNLGGLRDFVHFAKVQPNGSLLPWSSTTSLPEAMQGHTMMSYGQYLYVLAPSRSVYYAYVNTDGTLGSWTPTTSLPQEMSGYASFTYNGTAYLVGGLSRSAYYAPIQGDGSLGQWQEAEILPGQRRGLWLGAANCYIYAVGGDDRGVYCDTAYFAPLQGSPTSTPTPSYTRTSTPTKTPTPTLTATPAATLTRVFIPVVLRF